jgi:hypothetical protein
VPPSLNKFWRGRLFLEAWQEGFLCRNNRRHYPDGIREHMKMDFLEFWELSALRISPMAFKDSKAQAFQAVFERPGLYLS